VQLKTCERCKGEFLASNARARFCKACYTVTRKQDRHQGRKNGNPQFRAVDGEGIGNEYVLLGVGQDQVEWPDGLRRTGDVFEYLYEDFLANREAFYVGFYLSYDWNHWLSWLPYDRIAYLVDPILVAKRRRNIAHAAPFPVRYVGWEFDWLPGKRLKFRPEEGKNPWMYLCDTGPFFQCSLLAALESRTDRETVTDEMVATIREGKEKRSTASLDDGMRAYNRLENFALESLLDEIDHSLRVLGTPLGKTEYHGPGQASQKWILKQRGIEEANHRVMHLEDSVYNGVVASYYGGIFEITAHGHIPGTSYEYDINSAYPQQIASLPCVCGEWEYSLHPDPTAVLTLVHGRFRGSDRWLGPLPFRASDRSILRPLRGSGWYWQHELDAATRAGLLDSFEPDAYVLYHGCGHGRILADIAHLYQERVRVGKDTTIGKGCKLIYNSAYGKFAQSVGNPQASNAVYASLITAGCRVMILDAIATHPGRTNALLMIATDAVFFTTRHPSLILSSELGAWECKQRENLTIFKPGMYWDDKAREAIRAGEKPAFKARGVRAADFEKVVSDMDARMALFAVDGGEWPALELPVRFAQVSIKQAYQRTKAQPEALRDLAFSATAAQVRTDLIVNQSSDPIGKRNTEHVIQGMMIRTFPYEGDVEVESLPYDERFGRPDNPLDEYAGEDLPLDKAIVQALQLN